MSDLNNEPSLPEGNRTTPARSPWAMLTLMIIIILILLLSSGALLYFALKKSDRLPSTKPEPTQTSPLPEKVEPAPVIQKKTVQPKPAPIPKQVTQAEEPTPKTENDQATPKKEQKKKGWFFNKKKEKTEEKREVSWPKLKLTGFGRSSDGKGGFAIINGEHIFLNQKFNQVTLVEIRENGVIVELQGEQKTLRVE